MEDVTYSIFGDGNIIRAFLPMHILFQLIMGYFYGKACVNKSIRDHVLAIVLPVLSHTLFDTFMIAMAIVVEGQSIEEMKNLTPEELMNMPYLNDLMITICCSAVTAIASLVLMIVLLRKIGVWSKNGEKQEVIREHSEQNVSKVG